MPLVSDTLSQIFSYVELKRMDTQGEGLTLSFRIKSGSVTDVEAARKAMLALAPGTTISIVDQPELVI